MPLAVESDRAATARISMMNVVKAKRMVTGYCWSVVDWKTNPADATGRVIFFMRTIRFVFFGWDGYSTDLSNSFDGHVSSINEGISVAEASVSES